MILYFSATGNTEYVAKKIAMEISDEAVDVFDRIRSGDNSALHSEKPFVFMSPVYAWRAPEFFTDWIKKTEFTGSRKAYFVYSCGGEIGSAGKYDRQLALSKNFEYLGSCGIRMPDNYIFASQMKNDIEASSIIAKSSGKIAQVSKAILEGKQIDDKAGVLGGVKSGLVNSMFSQFNQKVSKMFYANENCNGCGFCEKLCVTKNISMKDGHPAWDVKCNQCYSCVHRCPKHAVEIKGHTEGKARYVCPADIILEN